METEVVDEIQEYSTASLHVNETKNVLNRKDEVLKENYNEKKTKLASTDAFDAPGQVVPSQSCLKSETDARQNNEHLTVPKASLEAMDCLEESQNFLKQREINQDKLILEDSEEYAVKTFHWPPIGFKEQINVVKTNKSGIFDQVVSHTNEENKDNEDSIGKQVAQMNTISYTLSNETNPEEEEKSATEYHNLTSILKKDNNQAKKTVHFRENIVSVKFYDISDEEDSDNDTVILSDPEDDDFRDQEVPFNTYDDYNTSVYYPSSISLNFIPQFTFPPVLKIANCELYDTIDDTDEQILAIMEDNDGRQHPNDLTTDKIYPEESISCSHNDHVTSKKVFSTNLDKMFHEESANEHQNNQITPRKLSENIEEALEFSEIQTPLALAKNGIDHSYVNALKNISGTFETETLLENQQTPTNVKILSGTLDEELEKSTPVAQNGVKQQTECNDDQHYFMKADDTIIENPEETKEPAIEIRQVVSYEDTNDLPDGQGACKDVNALIETQAEANEMKEAPTNKRLPVTDIAEPSEENMVSKLELITDDKARPTQVNVPGESKESSEVEVTPSSSSGRLAFHGNCGSSLLWRGPRSINSLILDEDFQVFTTPSAEKEIIHQHKLTKEEITTPKIPLTNIESLELNILPGMWSVATEHCDKELKLEKYDHSFLSSPDHVNEFEETWEPAEFPNKKQKMNFDQSNELWLKHGYLHSDTGAEQYETEFQEHPKTKIRSVASLERENKNDTLSVNQDMHNLTTQIVPDMYNGQEQLKPMNDLSRVVPSGAEDVLMNSTNTALQCSRQSYKTLEDVKSCITPYHQDLSSQTKHGRRKLRVGLSKSTKVKSLHPYWSKERIKESGSNS